MLNKRETRAPAAAVLINNNNLVQVDARTFTVRLCAEKTLDEWWREFDGVRATIRMNLHGDYLKKGTGVSSNTRQ